MRIWRICRSRHVASAFSGEGARRGSARWNSAGVPIAYASEHLSLAALELFVHVDREDEPQDLVAVEAEIAIEPEEVSKQQREILKKLGSEWRLDMRVTRSLGDTWFAAQDSLIMMVPSVVIDMEWNILINPQHRDFATLKGLQTRPFRFDSRMFKR